MDLLEDFSSLSVHDSWVSNLTQGQPVVSVDINPACGPGENFVSQIKRVILHYKTLDNREGSVSVIIKEMYPSEALQCLIMDCHTMFKNEISAYQKVLPILMSAAKFKPSANPQLSPIIYHATAESLVLQDLQPLGFKMADRHLGLGLEELRLALNMVAFLHAQSFKLKKENRQKWNECCQHVNETVFCERYHGKPIEIIWENSLKTALKILRASEDPDLQKMAEILTLFSGRVMSTFWELTQPPEGFQGEWFSAICHGDLWSNNLVFRYTSFDIPEEVRLLDFQAMRHSSCSLDVLHLLCTSSISGLLAQYYQELIQYYYTCLKNHLPNTPIPFSLEDLFQELKNKSIFGVLLGFMMIPCVTSDSSLEDFSLNDLSSEENFQKNYESLGENCHLRVKQLVKDLIKIGLLTNDF